MEQTVTKEFISPFSYIKHDWKLDWTIVPSNTKYERPNENRTKNEERALEGIASVGVIGGLQLKNIFNITNNQLKSMCNRKLLERHSLYKNNREIPIYTVGKFGANKVMPEYESNYWIEMDTIQVLKSVSFFQFYQLFDQAEIIPVPEPFTAGIVMNNKRFYIYVAKDGVKDLAMFLKWKKHFNESIFILTENLNYIHDLNIFMETEQLKIRAILDEQLKRREFKLYHYDKDTGKWVNS